MTIEFTKEQYISLLKIMFLGQWVANSFRNEPLKEFEAIEQYIMSYANQLDATDIVEYDGKIGMSFPSKAFEFEMHEFIDEYNDDYFWEELVYKLARRDLLKKISEENFKKMSIKEKIEAEDPLLDKYGNEINKNGIENLVIKRKQRLTRDKK